MSPSEETVPVFFVTTSSRKADHLKYLSKENKFEEYNLQMYHLPWEYQELQTDVMEYLMSEAMNRQKFRKISDTFFIIEQTSVFFDSDEIEGPGQYFKKWWQSRDEERLEILISREPGVRVESGLALNVPGDHSLTFTNSERGTVRLDGEILEENKKYSWLSAEDFSSYFSPEGTRKVYTEMSIGEFDSYDFRKPNFEKIAERLHGLTSLLRSGINIEDLQKAAKEYAPPSEWRTPDEGIFQPDKSSPQRKLTDDYDT